MEDEFPSEFEEDDDYETVDNPEVRRVAELIKAVFMVEPSGGDAHVVIVDENVETHFIEWCINEAIPMNYHHAGADVQQITEVCLQALLPLSEDERVSAIRRAVS